MRVAKKLDQHFRNSSYRERLLEHLFIGELLKLSWLSGDCALELSKPEVDRSGYDLIAEANGYIRHIQLKTTFVGSRNTSQNIQLSLGNKPSGCVILIHFDQETLSLGPFLFFGGEPGQPLPSVLSYKVAKHTKANSLGVKAERPNIRSIPSSSFQKIASIEELYIRLFGASQCAQSYAEAPSI
ncbi:hypothetical protein [Arenimonas alkanexedens]